jgi:uncharacterized membrane protein YfcA
MLVESAPALRLGVLFGAAVWAGAQNQLAGGGTFITLPALILTGMDARAANITSTVALFPGQLTGGWMARRLVSGAGRLSFRALVAISLIGGAVGSVLLLLTPTSFFDQLVPWLVLFATAAFAWGSFGRRPAAGSAQVAPWAAGLIQFGIAIYGGYFGGGIGFLMMAVLSLAGMAVHTAGATKNVLAGVMNASAVLVFLLSGEVRWLAAAVAATGAMLGSVIGARLMLRVNERTLRVVVIVIGVILTLGMFARSRQHAAPVHAHVPHYLEVLHLMRTQASHQGEDSCLRTSSETAPLSNDSGEACSGRTWTRSSWTSPNRVMPVKPCKSSYVSWPLSIDGSDGGG